MVLYGMQWRHRRPIAVLRNIPDATLLQHLKHLLSVVRRGQVWPKVIWATRITLVDKGDAIARKDLAVDLALMALLAGTKKSRKRPFIDMVKGGDVQSLYPTNLPQSSSRYVGRLFLPFHSMLQSAAWWITGHSHSDGDKTLRWRGCNHGYATTLMTWKKKR